MRDNSINALSEEDVLLEEAGMAFQADLSSLTEAFCDTVNRIQEALGLEKSESALYAMSLIRIWRGE